MIRQKIRKSHYLAAFAMATLIFIAGILFGSYFSTEKLNSLDYLEQDLKMSTMGTELQYALISENPCSVFNYTELTSELYDIGTKLDYMETQLGKNNIEVLNLKQYYSLLEIRHWLFLKKAKKECNENYDLIIYFYSNQGDCDDCEQQGNVLNLLHQKNPDLNTYSFDINLKNPALNTVKASFGVAKTPTLIINDKVFVGFMDKEEVEKVLNKV